ncbi:MBL fold metallo-hydrolase [Streptomyces armeniacus]|uniref:MBL fold metallo-hydrolase n=1 Tax=Streptomyces armeniacus TaxID=83291 RepID=A0A345XSE2_9ACTN|nr:MBL fold metallo-hydrolase [Streptomyces armeniacus]AXK34558.1 MBL fold metallo-hydrolase [Streptomyces armeniacus]
MTGLRPASFGAEPTGERLERILRSPHYDPAAGVFRNPVEARTEPQPQGSRMAMIRALLSRKDRRPAGRIPVRRPDLSEPPASGLRLTWLGHSTVLAEIDGRRVLFDPVWGERCSPFAFVGPRRFHPPPLPLDGAGRLDAVVISHDHYDHLDMGTVRGLAGQGVHVAAPLGVGAHLERWGVPPSGFTELDWHESVEIAGLTLTATPARHFCGRGLRNPQRTLWASWVVSGPDHRIFHSGDTGYFPGFAEIGADHGPFDATMIQVGAYSDFWPDIHMTPEEGVRTHLDLSSGRTGAAGGALLPIHWGTFNLAPHPWQEPAERMLPAAAEADVRVAIPAPGQSFEPSGELPAAPWWQALSGASAARGGRPAVAQVPPGTPDTSDAPAPAPGGGPRPAASPQGGPDATAPATGG